MKTKLQKNVFYAINDLSNTVVDLQRQIIELNQKLENYQDIGRSHLLRVKNGDQLSDDYILNGRKYNDMSPDAAFKFFQQQDTQFIVLDVTKDGFQPSTEIEEALHIPADELTFRYGEIINKSTPILVISEDGVSSIIACEFLNHLGFYNVNNVSGGYKYWPESRAVKTVLKQVA